MATITIREKEYELIENEYALLNAIILFLRLLDQEGAKKFVLRHDTSLEDLQKEISEKYNEASQSGKDAIASLSNRVMFALNLDPQQFPEATNDRELAHKYIKLLVPSAPNLDENFAGTEISEFLLAVAIPEAIRKEADEKSGKPSTPKSRKSKNKGFSTNAPELENIAPTPLIDVLPLTQEDDEAAGALIEKLAATSGPSIAIVDDSTKTLDVETKVVDLESIAAIAPEIVEQTDNYYAELLAEQQRNTVTILNKGEVVPTDIEEELGG